MLDFKLSLLEDKHFKSGERIALWSKELENTNKEYQVIKSSIEEILALQDKNGDWSGLGLTPEQVQRLLAGDKTVLDEIKLTGENASEIMEALLEKENELQEKYKQMADYMKSIEEELTNQLDEYNEAFEK
jgi:DNA repair exonuclease SbcCD ATPase subunit